MENEKKDNAFNFELRNSNEPLYQKDTLKLIKSYHKTTKRHKDNFININTDNLKNDSFLELVSEIDFAFYELIEKIEIEENLLYLNLDKSIENLEKRDKLISKIRTYKESLNQWKIDVKDYFEVYFLNSKSKSEVSLTFNKNPFEDVFNGTDYNNYLIFKSFSERYIIDRYNDYSFIFQKMKSEKRITRISHFDFMEWLKQNGFISVEVYQIFYQKGCFTTKGLNKPERNNNYDLIIKDIIG